MLTRISTIKPVARAFSSFQATAENNYKNFRSAYVDNLSKFKQTIDEIDHSAETASLKSKKAYTHPYNNEHSQVNLTPGRASEIFFEFVGPEQVSPHYESFLASRKWAIGFWTTCLALAFVGNSVDMHWVAKSSMIPFVYYTTLFYWTFEGRKSIMKPFYTRWYRTLAFNDFSNMQTYYKDIGRLAVKERISVAREQMDYYIMHGNFNQVKAESINRFLAHEQMNLQKHINDRAMGLLKGAKAMETSNQRTAINKVVASAIEEVDRKLVSESAMIDEAMFEIALAGISQGKCDYKGDPILPMAQQTVREKVREITSLSEEEQVKMIALTEAQLEGLRLKDDAAKKEFLETAPKMDGMTMADENAKQILNNWGK